MLPQPPRPSAPSPRTTRGSPRTRAQLLGLVASRVRQVLVDHARARRAAKRGGAARVTARARADARTDEQAAAVLAVHEALERLPVLDPAQARLVELPYFARLSVAEAAAALGVPPARAEGERVVASARLRRGLEA